MSTDERKLLEEVIQEFRLLRQAVERIETQLASAPVKSPRKSRQPELLEADCKKIYSEIGEEYAHDRMTRKLDALLARPKSDLSLFCSVNNLPVDLHSGKANIRSQILARIREDEQLSATYPIPSHAPAYLGERNK